MIELKIIGMTCAVCAGRVERALQSVSGVTEVSVNLLTNFARVEGDTTVDALIGAVQKAGYDAVALDTYGSRNTEESESTRGKLRDSLNVDLSAIKLRLVVSVCLFLALWYCSTCIGMFGFAAPSFLHNPHNQVIVQILLSATLLFINHTYFTSGLRHAMALAPNMDTLVALGSGVSFLYSLAHVFYTYDVFSRQNVADLASNALSFNNLYFESAGGILVFISIGKLLEARAKGQATNALKRLVSLAPDDALILRDGVATLTPSSRILVGDVFILHPGDRAPVDGVVEEGTSTVDESSLTGESLPVDKLIGSSITSGSLNLTGVLHCRATRVGADTFLAQVIKVTTEATSTKAPVARLADQTSAVFVPIVIGIAVLTTVVWTFLGQSLGFALVRGVSVLVISCPCALGLATPASIMVGMGVGARRGILFKRAEALETTGKCRIVALDKTGVVTVGTPNVSSVHVEEKSNRTLLYEITSALESRSNHPLAKSLSRYLEEQTDVAFERSNVEIVDFREHPGNGLSAQINGQFAIAGNYEFVTKYISIPSQSYKDTLSLAERGETIVYIGYGEDFLGFFTLADLPRDDSAKAIAELSALKLHTVMLTGDLELVASTIAKTVGIDEYHANLLPVDKERKVSELKELGKVLFVGDGINDAPALARADIGCAVGAGSDVALDSADLVLVNNSLVDLCRAIRLSRATLFNIKENLFWAFIYNIIGIPLAAGVFIPVFGWTLRPSYGALAMCASSFFVVTNALRLNWVKLDGSHISKRRSLVTLESETSTIIRGREMKRTIQIEGMMCSHCEGHVKRALEQLPFVTSAQASHTSGTAEVLLSENVPSDEEIDSILTQTVVEQGYEVKGVLHS
ncbi:MAG: heavy metal translocating P-type ATPase [Planctomycetia bacterium]|nr:heavy metal translocating P-type ATPase [Planctomycetia bacterium]